MVRSEQRRALLHPDHASWANPIEAHFGPLRQFVLANRDYPDHAALGRAIRAYLRWRNTHAATPASSTPNAGTAPASAVNNNTAGAAPAAPHSARTFVVRALADDQGGCWWPRCPVR